MSHQRFRATLSVRGTQVGVVMPFDPDEIWGAKARHDVSGTIDGHTVRGPLQKDRDGFLLSLGPTWRAQAELSESAEVEVVLAPEGPQLENIPAELSEALQNHPDALTFFFSIAPFYRKNYVRWIESAKRPETRAARVAETVTLLGEGKRQK
jgi:Bacteriocin-protection, YdeI or OmpD-Associated/Domain of unknown function (DUF1905)